MASVILHKLSVGADLFVEAHDRFNAADRNIDYVVTIVLAGAVVGIVAPLLKEQGGHPAHALLAKLSEYASLPGEPAIHQGMFRAVYNSLKHSGNKNENREPSEDLEICADLRQEAAHMLDAALKDFREIAIPPQVRGTFSEKFVYILEEGEYYA